MVFNSIAEIEARLNELTILAIRQVARNVGVAHVAALRRQEAIDAILSIAKGEIEPLPIDKRHILQDPLAYNQGLVDAVLAMCDAKANK